jgi:hypothetical protein
MTSAHGQGNVSACVCFYQNHKPFSKLVPVDGWLDGFAEGNGLMVPQWLEIGSNYPRCKQKLSNRSK